MQFIQNYAAFLLNTVTIVIAIVSVLIAIVAISARNKKNDAGQIVIKKLNTRFEEYRTQLQTEIFTKTELTAFKKKQKADKKNLSTDTRKKIFVINFNGDMKASQVTGLREEITAILTVATENDEVVLLLESAGGLVHSYGLAASQLQRLRDHNIRLTVCVDKVAASGGYMMACVANKIVAAPFAIIGSIGVLLQLPNFHKLLEKHHIEFEQLTAGEYKRTLTLFGENTDKARSKMREDLEETHQLFKDFIKTHRTEVIINNVATGEHWFATQAIEYKLVDMLQTSDDHLLQASQAADLYEIKKMAKKSLLQKLGQSAQASYEGILNYWWKSRQEHLH
jgi:serine protease SohB